jgi:hypothetical protein
LAENQGFIAADGGLQSTQNQFVSSRDGKEDTIMEVFDAVRTILAVRRYQDRPVPEPVIQRVLEAG